MSDRKSELQSLLDEVRRLRDELRLQVELGKMEARDEWDDLEKRWQAFARKAELEDTAEGLGTALSGVGKELRSGYERLKKAL